MAKILTQCIMEITGSNGTVKVFKTQDHLDYEDTEYRITDANRIDKEAIGKYDIHYKVVIDEEDFWIPSLYAVEFEGEIIQDKFDDWYKRNSNDEIKDHYSVARELGIPIDNTQVADIDWDKIERDTHLRRPRQIKTNNVGNNGPQ